MLRKIFIFILMAMSLSAISQTRYIPIENVRLLDSRWRDNMRRDSAWMMSLPVERLLHSFRNTAGVFSSKEGGYMTVKKLGGWESLDCDLRGHTTGHLMSALALMYKATGEECFRMKGDSLVAGLAECQSAMKTGYVSAFPEGLIDRNIDGKSVWAPWYTLHKLLAGLVMQYQAGNSQALDVASRFADWAYRKLSLLTEETREKMLRNEFGGINEAFYNLYAVTGNAQHKWLAEFFYHNEKMDKLKAYDFDMGTMHTNTFIPKVIAETRNPDLNDWSWIEAWWQSIADNHLFCTGELSDKEHFFPVEDYVKHISGVTGETCCTYNMLKLSKNLFEKNPDVKYQEYIECALVNHILGQQDPESGMVAYFLPLMTGSHRVYSTYDRSFWCCVGSGFENHAKYGEFIYSEALGQLMVNQFIASELTWNGMTVRQETTFPYGESARLTITGKVKDAIMIRYPSWAQSVTVKVNGKKVSAKPKNGYITLNSSLFTHHSNEVELSFPMKDYEVNAHGDQSRVALMHGPVVMAGELGIEGMQSPAPFSDPAQYNDYYTYDYKVPENLKTIGVDRAGKDVKLSPLFDIHRQRYVVYWNK